MESTIGDARKAIKPRWKKKTGKLSAKEVGAKKNPVPGTELDFIADGMGKRTELYTKQDKKSKKLSMIPPNTEEKIIKRSKGKKSESNKITVESAGELLEQVISSARDILSERRKELNRLKMTGSVTPKNIEAIRKLECLCKGIKCYQDMMIITKQGLIKDKNPSAANVVSEDVSSMLGFVKISIKEVKGFSQLKHNGHCEVVFLYGDTKHRIRGSIKSTDDIIWNDNEFALRKIEYDCIVIKFAENRLFGKFSSIANGMIQIENLIKARTQETEVKMNEFGTITISHTWLPFDFNDIPSQYFTKNPTSDVLYGNGKNISSDSKNVNSQCSNDAIYENDLAPFSMENDKIDEIFLTRMKESAQAIATEIKDPGDCAFQEGNVEDDADKEIWAEALVLSMVINHVLDDYRGRYEDLQPLEMMVWEIINELKNCTGSNENYIYDEIRFDIESHEGSDDILKSDNLRPKNIIKKFSEIQFDADHEVAYKAVIAHLRYSLEYIKDVGAFGVLKVKEVIALHQIEQQGRILKLIMDIGRKPDLELEDFPELVKRRTLLELWRSCCDGETELCATSNILCLEFESEFGREVKRKHPDVANKLFPELVRRILRLKAPNINEYQVTVFQLLEYSKEMSTDGSVEDFSKTVDKLALELFLTSTLRSDNDALILVAIRKVGTLLALRTSNLCALSHLLLSHEKTIRSAAAAHIMHIGKDISLRDKALVSYAELLESDLKRDRQSACIALGFLGGKECIPQIAYLYHSDVDLDVREAATHALNSFGDEGMLALEHAALTLLAQTRTQRVTLKTTMRLGTAL